MGNKKKIKVKGNLAHYIKWPLYLNIIWFLFIMVGFAINVKTGALITLAEIIYLVVSVAVYFAFKPNIMKNLVDFGAEYSQVQRQMLHDMEIPYSLLDENGKVMWTNEQMDILCQGKNIRNRIISSIFPEIKKETMEFDEMGRSELEVKYEESIYKVVFKLFLLNNSEDVSSTVALVGRNSGLISMYMFDETQIHQLARENKEEKLITGHIYIDNYD